MEGSCSTTLKPSNLETFKLTLKAWPVIAAATIGLCYLTQLVAGWFGIELPDQRNIDVVRQCGLHALDSLKSFGVFAFLCAQVLVLLPAVEELIFRGSMFKLPLRTMGKWTTDDRRHPTDGTGRSAEHRTASAVTAILSSALFSAAHYLFQPFPDSAFIALFFFGLAQCWLYRKTNRIWCAMLNHGLFNLTNLVLLFILPEA